MRPDEVGAALRPVADAFDRLGIRYYVGGSIASSVRGAPRASIDVDVAAELEPVHVAAFVRALAEGYYVSEERVRDAVAARRSFHVIHLASMMKVDVFVSRRRPFDLSAFDRLTRESLDAAGTSAPHPRTIDRAYLGRWAVELGVGDLLDRALAAADAGG